MVLKFQLAEKKCLEKVRSLRLLVFKPKLEKYFGATKQSSTTELLAALVLD